MPKTYVVYSKKYDRLKFGLAEKRYCDNHGLNPDTVDIDELRDAMTESRRAAWREKSKVYYENNSDKIKASMQRIREEHREEIMEQKKIYSQRKYTCECGCEVARNNLARHLETDKHRKFVHLKKSAS